jgi:DNA polymerase
MALHSIALKPGADIDGFRHAVRALIAERTPPQNIMWSAGDVRPLFGDELAREGTASDAPPVLLSRAVGELVASVVCHHDPERYALLYTLIWRVRYGEHALLDVQSDPLVHRLTMMDKAVRRDLHKMHAFLRFRRTENETGERFVAWFEPDHHILEASAAFFVGRFRSLVWSILTPLGSLHWNREQLVIGPPGRRGDAPAGDVVESDWRSYYESTFNPARTNPKAMRTQMPKKYWRNMPETMAIPHLIQSAATRVVDMIERQPAEPIKRNPQKAVTAMSQQNPKTLAELNRIIAASDPLVAGATHAVLGEGPVGAAVAFVGEQPGDQEDLQRRPFVGPAGQLLRRAMAEVGIDDKEAYFTNAVKHFKFEQRGKRRIHKSPTAGEVKHYRWWLEKELDFVKPAVVVALGGTAGLALAGKALSVTKCRGEMRFDSHRGYLSVHPSYLLRIPDADAKQSAYRDFLADLAHVRKMIEHPETARLAAAHP